MLNRSFISKNNIELVPLTEKYVKGFKLKEWKQKNQNKKNLLNKSKSVVVYEFLFTVSHIFFENTNQEDYNEVG